MAKGYLIEVDVALLNFRGKVAHAQEISLNFGGDPPAELGLAVLAFFRPPEKNKFSCSPNAMFLLSYFCSD